ncbi:MAG: T9SS type A sorting domain-containing protein, partial [Ignavibacteria bacterium]
LDEVFVNVKDSLYGFRDNGNPIRVDESNGLLADSVTNFVPGYAMNSTGSKILTGIYKDQFTLMQFNIDSMTSNPAIIRVQGTGLLASPSLIFNGSSILHAGTIDGKVNNLNINTFVVSYDSVTVHSLPELSLGRYQTYTASKNIYRYLTLGKITGNSNDDTVIITPDNKLLLNGNVISNNLGINTIYSSPIVCDLQKNGHMDIIFCADDKVFAINQFGIPIDNFPFKANGVSKISSGCSVADIDGDGVNEVIFGTGDGRIYAYNVNGKVLDGFPLFCGKEVKAVPAIINTGGNFGIIAYSQDGFLYGWKTMYQYDANRVVWKNYLNDNLHRNSNFATSQYTASGPCLPGDKVYNWPNPVYGKTTNIRYFLNGTASNVQIKIMDLSGELVTTLTGSANTGFDNEVQWDVSSVQSGIYIALLQLQNGSCSDVASIKIAVVK